MNFNINFFKYRFVAFFLSALLIGLSALLFLTKNLNLGIDFKGGIMIEAKFSDVPDLALLRNKIDNLVRERQIVRSTREEHDADKDLQPLLFAGVIIEGGIIGYDSNITSGGRGARTLGIGTTTTYRRDVVTVSLRGISVLTGEILLNVQSKKTILSVGTGFDVFKFIDLDTQLVEIEDGVADNESITVATRAAIEAGVVGLIEQVHERGYWTIQEQTGEESE